MLQSPLSRQIFKAVENNNYWEDILELLIEYCGAKKGIITLRNMQTAELILPQEARQKHCSPSLKGFDPEFVKSYANEFYQYDPWTQIERDRHPYAPYAFSDYLSNAELEQSKFWQWLEPQGINDAVVAELYSTSDEWIALNLHFNNHESGKTEKILKFLTDILPELRNGWRLSEKFRLYQNHQENTQTELNITGAYVLTDETFKISFATYEARKEIHKHLDMTSSVQIKQTLTLPETTKQRAYEMMSLTRQDFKSRFKIVDLLESKIPNARISVVLMDISRSFVGKTHATFMILVEYTPIWETKGLTPRQSQVVKYVAEGKTVEQFARENDIKKTTAYDFLKDAKIKLANAKLGNLKASDIRATHLLYLEKSP